MIFPLHDIKPCDFALPSRIGGAFARAIWCILLSSGGLAMADCQGQSHSESEELLWRNRLELVGAETDRELHENLRGAMVQPGRSFKLRNRMQVIDTLQTQKTVRHMEARLSERGYFNAHVQAIWSRNEKNKSTHVEQTFFVRTGPRWRWSRLECLSDSAGFEGAGVLTELNLGVGDHVDLERLEHFRQTWSAARQSEGYLGLLSEHVSYAIDTLAGIHRASLQLLIRPALDGPHRPAVIREIQLNTEGIDPDVASSMLRVELGQPHSPKLVELTYRRLTQLPAAGRVDIQVEQILGQRDTAASSVAPNTPLERPVKLTFTVHPRQRFEWGYRTGLVSQQGLGAEGAIRFSDHNSRAKSERLQLELEASVNSIPAQINEDGQQQQSTIFNAFSYGPHLKWRMDRLLPFKPARFPRSNEPLSQLELAWSQEHRPDFDRRIAQMSLVERFTESEHRGSKIQLRPLDLSFARIELTPQGEAFLNGISSLLVRNAYTSHAIFASGASWSLAPNMGEQAELNIRLGASSGGHLLSALIAPGDSVAWVGGGTGGSGGTDEPGAQAVPISRFVKMHFEVVAGWIPAWATSSRRTTVQGTSARGVSAHLRLVAAVGHSTAPGLPMPLERMELAGGPNSMRGWLAQSLGPGGFDKSISGEIYARGDMRLEANAELRIQLNKSWSIAGFTDAGNVWMTTPDALRPNADFQWDRFASEIAISTGVGLRFDFEYFMVRIDAGHPVRYPVAEGGSNWRWGDEGWSIHPAVALPF